MEWWVYALGVCGAIISACATIMTGIAGWSLLELVRIRSEVSGLKEFRKDISRRVKALEESQAL